MAFDAKKIFPIDRKPSVAVGVGLPFTAPGVFPSTYTTKMQLRTTLLISF